MLLFSINLFFYSKDTTSELLIQTFYRHNETIHLHNSYSLAIQNITAIATHGTPFVSIYLNIAIWFAFDIFNNDSYSTNECIYITKAFVMFFVQKAYHHRANKEYTYHRKYCESNYLKAKITVKNAPIAKQNTKKVPKVISVIRQTSPIKSQNSHKLLFKKSYIKIDVFIVYLFKDSHFIRNRQLLEANMSAKRTKYHFLKAQKPIFLKSFVEFPNLLLLLR